MNLEIGKPAPAFQSVNQNNETISLSDFKGKKVVLYFYPKDDTPGCTAEACSLRDNYLALQEQGYVVLGVSPDTASKHKKFIDKYSLPFDLLADTDNTIALAYGVWVEKSMYGRKYMGIARTTFLINEEGLLSEIIEKVDTKNHATQILS
jgi:peroxiredoxin Q/BCP